jgi:hypothetical protein
VLTFWLLGKLRESEQNEKLDFMVSFLVLFKRIERGKRSSTNYSLKLVFWLVSLLGC